LPPLLSSPLPFQTFARSLSASMSGADKVAALKKGRILAATGCLFAIAGVSSLWADIRTAQLKGWTLRVMDSFDLLNEMMKVNIPDMTTSGKESRWHGIVEIANAFRNKLGNKTSGADAEVKLEDIRATLIAGAYKKIGVDICEIFDEDETGSIPLSRLVYGSTILHILSRDKHLEEAQTHQIMWIMLAHAAGESTSEKTESDAISRNVPATEVLRWLEAAAALGVVRGWEFLEDGGLCGANRCAARLFEKLFDGQASVSQDDFAGIVSKVEYEMFWNRNDKKFRAIDFYRDQERKAQHAVSKKNTPQRNVPPFKEAD